MRFKNLKRLGEMLGISDSDQYTKLKKTPLIFYHHRAIVTSIMIHSLRLQELPRADLQIHNHIADEEVTVIELSRAGLL